MGWPGVRVGAVVGLRSSTRARARTRAGRQAAAGRARCARRRPSPLRPGALGDPAAATGVSAVSPRGRMSNVGAFSLSSGARRRVSVRVGGVVQGVGFRPHVYRLAEEFELDGFVLNDARGVMLEVEGPPTAVERFLERLVAE